MGGDGPEADTGGDAVNLGCPGLSAACSRRQEWSFLRDQMINPTSLATATAAATKALNSGIQAKNEAGGMEPARRANPDISNPTSMLAAKAITNQGMT